MAGLMGMVGGGKSSGPVFQPPTPRPVTRMPDEQDPRRLEEARRRRLRAVQEGGRSSTDLTGRSGDYSNDLLGE